MLIGLSEEKQALIERYQSRIDTFGEILQQLKRKSILFVAVRVLVFFSILFCFYLVFSQYNTIWLFLLLAVAVIFGILVKLHQKLKRQIKYQECLIEVNSIELKALNGDWRHFNSADEFINPAHNFSYDIDLFGRNSLFQYINRTATIYGRLALKESLEFPTTNAAEIRVHQQIIADFQSDLEVRQRIQALGMVGKAESMSVKALNKWLDAPNLVKLSGFMRSMIYLIPIVSVFMLGATWIFDLGAQVFLLYAILPLFLGSIQIKLVTAEYEAASKFGDDIEAFSKILLEIEQYPAKTSELQLLQEKLKKGGLPSQEMKKLAGIIASFDNRNNAIGYVLFTIFLFWDIRMIAKLNEWKERNKLNVKQWLSIMGDIEKYASLANFGFNHPGFVLPQIVEDKRLSASQVGHVLIDEKQRVCNDFELNKKGEFVILTGANMAGKSTFLRTLGLNFVLAMNGAVVCAKSFKIKPFLFITSMRTTDSLEENESYFFTELKRLKYITDMATKNQDVFVILDEILKGTNSRDKERGSWLFMEKLLSLGVSGIVATHDLSLCKMENTYKGQIKNLSFDVEIDGNDVLFDYKIREGVCKNMNATVLMEQLGLIQNNP